jgi:hypothetical protein
MKAEDSVRTFARAMGIQPMPGKPGLQARAVRGAGGAQRARGAAEARHLRLRGARVFGIAQRPPESAPAPQPP